MTRKEFVFAVTFVGAICLADVVAIAISVSNIEPDTSTATPFHIERLTGVDLGRSLFQRFDCKECHGVEGVGGVPNPNSVAGEPPNLREMADRLFLFEPEDAEFAINMLTEGTDPAAHAQDPPFRAFNRFIPQLDAVRGVITNGNVVEPVDPDGPEPFSMPAWGDRTTAIERDALIAYLISLFPWDEM